LFDELTTASELSNADLVCELMTASDLLNADFARRDDRVCSIERGLLLTASDLLNAEIFLPRVWISTGYEGVFIPNPINRVFRVEDETSSSTLSPHLNTLKPNS
jgi:hypothetical protein